MSAELQSLISEIQATHLSWSYEKVFAAAMERDGQSGTFGRPKADGGARLVAEAATGMDGEIRHPRVARELGKLDHLHQEKESSTALAHADRLAKIHDLMKKNPSLKFDEAFSRICKEENGISNDRPPMAALANDGKRKEKLTLIEGRQCGLLFPLFPENGS
jgi:hypothetical protein